MDKLALNLQVLGLKADTLPDQNSSIFLLSNNCDPSSVPSSLTYKEQNYTGKSLSGLCSVFPAPAVALSRQEELSSYRITWHGGQTNADKRDSFSDPDH